MKPQISIILPFYNEKDFISETIASIKKQTFTDWELLIIVDSEEEQMKDFIKELINGEEKITVIYNEKNLGITKSLNKGLQKANGTFIARIDADDVAHENRLLKQYNFLKNNLEVGVVGSWGNVIDSEGNIIGAIENAISNKKITRNILFKNQFIHSSVMFRKSLIEKFGGYNEAFLRSQDYELWLRLRKKTQFHNIAEPLIYYRSHSKSITQTKNIEQRILGIKMMYNFYKNDKKNLLKFEKLIVFQFFLKQYFKITMDCFFKR